MEKKQQTQSSQQPVFWKVLKKTSLSFWGMAPMLLGVIGLVGFLQALVTPDMLASLFQGHLLADTMIGTLAGSLAVGNPVVSYLIGGELVEKGTSLYAVSAFLLSWVTLGFIQLPAEVEVFGGRFTLYRNILAFIFTLVIAAITTLSLGMLS